MKADPPEVNYRRLLNLYHEFSSKLEAQHQLYLDCIIGFSSLHERLFAQQDDVKRFLDGHEYGEAEFQDTCSITYKELCGKELHVESTSPLMKQGDVKERTREDGRNYWLLGSQCIVSMYSYWEDYLRAEIAEAIGKSKEDVKHDIWGDLRHLRQSIVHNNDLATSYVTKCKIIKVFKPGDPIKLGFRHMSAIFRLLAIYRNELHRMSLPQRPGIRVPG